MDCSPCRSAKGQRVARLPVAPDDDVRDLLELGARIRFPSVSSGAVASARKPAARSSLRDRLGIGLGAPPRPGGSAPAPARARAAGRRPCARGGSPTKRSSEPSRARWIIAGVCSALSVARIGEAEPLRHLQVELHGAELPAPAERVGHVQVDLRPVERALALALGVVEPRARRAPCGARPRRSPTPRPFPACCRGGARAPPACRARRGRRGSRRSRGRPEAPRGSARRCRRHGRRPGRNAGRAGVRARSPESSFRWRFPASARRRGRFR